MSDLTEFTIAEIRDGLAKKSFSAAELTKAYIANIERARSLNAYIVETPEKALTMAAESDRRIAAGEARALEGVPLGIKDLFATEGVHTQAASHVLDAFKPTYESTVTANLSVRRSTDPARRSGVV
jgi:aspartyl-tRNA(Asn)/glutamyl-tRNA(Gln) amidotransferase subunit A